jgi:hypothetical protein
LRAAILPARAPTTVLRDDKLSTIIWLPSGRFLYSRVEARGAEEADNLWELKVDDGSGFRGANPAAAGLDGLRGVPVQRVERRQATREALHF